ncbi:BI1-like protein [Carex littledalei]|uniref:BI1-like protein n=1 Tax=Carex littledalei TaxID=544730 RepID=A0A833QRY8_9POAL|nr:BI1-like protein [Carex littledalei]
MASMFNFQRMEKQTDIESGQPEALYPGMVESPELRWAFIRKIYAILTVQLALTAVVAAVVVTVKPISHFFVSSNSGLALYIVLLILPFISKIILEAAILTSAVVVGLTLYTFWAAKRGYDFNFLGPFLFSAVIVLLVFSFIQILFPLGKISVMIYGGLGALVFSGYIIYDTDNIIKRHTYDEYIWAAVSLYLDIINLFLQLLSLLRAADS